MDSINARSLIETNKEAATTELVSRIEAVITDRANKGWNRADVIDIIKEYNFPIVNDAYSRLRTNGFSVNVLAHTINW